MKFASTFLASLGLSLCARAASQEILATVNLNLDGVEKEMHLRSGQSALAAAVGFVNENMGSGAGKYSMTAR